MKTLEGVKRCCYRNNSQLASSSQSETLAVVKRNLNLEKEVTTQLIIPNINSDPSTPRTAPFTAAEQKCLTCKDSIYEIIRLLQIINGRVTQNAELITAILNSINENNIQDNNPKAVDIDIPAKSYIELMELFIKPHFYFLIDNILILFLEKKNPLTKRFTEKQVEERLAIFLAKATERCNRRVNEENKRNDPEEELVK
ncbi:hypothetical protein JTB14_022583 [Gonioctena quinquepunctata]|nr:hypothetical protein JTB14_022583 [Gonioctena quinquepunctata]